MMVSISFYFCEWKTIHIFNIVQFLILLFLFFLRIICFICLVVFIYVYVSHNTQMLNNKRETLTSTFNVYMLKMIMAPSGKKITHAMGKADENVKRMKRWTFAYFHRNRFVSIAFWYEWNEMRERERERKNEQNILEMLEREMLKHESWFQMTYLQTYAFYTIPYFLLFHFFRFKFFIIILYIISTTSTEVSSHHHLFVALRENPILCCE